MLIVVCAHCGERMEYAGMGSVVIVTVERWRKGGTTVDRRYLCPACADEIAAWFAQTDQSDANDLPMGG